MNLLSPLTCGSALVQRFLYWGTPKWPFPPGLGPLRALSFIHFGRWVIIPKGKFPRLSPEQPKETLAHDYLLFASNYNGQWDQYIDAFSDALSTGLDLMWKGSVNWVPSTYVGGLKRYIRWHQIKRGVVPTDHFYCAYPHASTSDVKAALDLCDAVADFKRVTPGGETDDALVERFQALVRSQQQCLGALGPPTLDADVLTKELTNLEEPVTAPPFR